MLYPQQLFAKSSEQVPSSSRSNPGRPRDPLSLCQPIWDPYDVWAPKSPGVHLKIKVDTCGEGNSSYPRITQQDPVSLRPLMVYWPGRRAQCSGTASRSQ